MKQTFLVRDFAAVADFVTKKLANDKTCRIMVVTNTGYRADQLGEYLCKSRNRELWLEPGMRDPNVMVLYQDQATLGRRADVLIFYDDIPQSRKEIILCKLTPDGEMVTCLD
jgi:hypothetical protein